ncbi:MAG: amylosucrase [Clostridiales bacterium]|nr:amylosucrase [Clostridiales bacterium]
MSDYQARLNRHLDELRWLYYELYEHAPNRDAAFQDLLGKMEQASRERRDGLKALDSQREQDPGWYKSNELLGMCLYVKPFAGTLQGVREKLDYIQECNVNYLHFMPLLDTVDGRSDGGYAVADFRKIKPELGTMEDLEELTADCHSRGISCCMDFVMNHTSEDHEWAKKARAGDPEYQARYFFYDTWDIPNEYEKHVPQVFPTTAPGNFTWLEDCGKIVLTSFYPYQWDLNYRNPVVFNDMADNMLFLANRGIDVVRVDAVPYIWKELGTDCRNLPKVHTIVRMCRMICEIVCPSVILLGEVVMAPEKLAPYFGTVEKPECHMLYNATTMCTMWSTVATRDTRLLRHQMDQVNSLPKEYLFLNYLRCHDDIGWGLDYPWLAWNLGQQEVPHKKYLNDFFTGKFPGSFARGELYNDDPRLGDARLCGTTASLLGVEKAEQGHDTAALELATDYDLMLHAFLLGQTGLPILYAGDEVGQLNDNTYHDDPQKADDSRYIHRGNFQWDLAQRRTDPATRQGKQFQGLDRLEAIRRANPVFRTEAEVWTFWAGDQALLGMKRQLNGQIFTAVYNFSEYHQTAHLEAYGPHTDLLTGAEVDITGEWNLPPYGFVWLLYKG